MIKLKDLLSEFYIPNIDDVRNNKEVKKYLDVHGFDETKKHINSIITWLLKLNGNLCWRVMALPQNIDVVNIEEIGIHWSADKESAFRFMEDEDEFHSLPNDYLALFKGKISDRIINFEETIGKKFWYLNETSKDVEKEITMQNGGLIYIYEVYKWNQNEKFSTQPISINRYIKC
jgi:hypothetical protein